MTVLVRALAVARRYGDVEALAPTDVELAAGETVALVGPNGAGKSTLLALLAGAIEPSAGSVETHARVGWVPQRPAHYARLSARENLELFARLEGVGNARGTAQDLLERFSLPDDRPSGEPRVLLLDEPTAALDPGQRRRVWEVVDALRGEGGAACFATQNLEEVEHADRVLVLLDGRVVPSTPEEVFG